MWKMPILHGLLRITWINFFPNIVKREGAHVLSSNFSVEEQNKQTEENKQQRNKIVKRTKTMCVPGHLRWDASTTGRVNFWLI